MFGKKQTQQIFYFFVQLKIRLSTCVRSFTFLAREYESNFYLECSFVDNSQPKKIRSFETFFYEILKTKYFIINICRSQFSHKRTECLFSVFCMNLHFLIALETYNEVLE